MAPCSKNWCIHPLCDQHVVQAAPVNSHFLFFCFPFQIVVTRHRDLTPADLDYLARSVLGYGYWPQLSRVRQNPSCFYGLHFARFETLRRVHVLICAAGDAQAWLPNAAADGDPSG
jgi:hypothetical protein